MLTDFLRLLIETIQFVWPAHIVAEYEQAGLYLCGHFRRVVGPGLKGKVPWFMRYINVEVYPYPITTGRMDITLSDSSTLSFDATAVVKVVDVAKALNTIDNYHRSATTRIAAILATRLAEVDAARLAPAGRKRLLTDLRRWINEETLTFGVECLDVAFNSFVVNIKTYRFLTDASAPLAEA